MRLDSANLELAALRSITSGDDRVVAAVLSRISRDSFAYEHTAEAYMRAMHLMRRTGEMPRWQHLLTDPVIGEDAREELGYRQVDPVRNRREADDLVRRLDEYRRARLLFSTARRVQEKMKGDSVDLDDLTDELTEAISGARAASDMQEHTTIIGGRELDRDVVTDALSDTEQEFIPTGIRAFDSQNQGVPRGAVFLLAGPTGGGKSVLAMQIAMHMASQGARVIIISLEMNRRIVVRRMLSNLTGVPLSRINRAHQLDEPTVRLLRRAWAEYHQRVRASCGRLRLVCPPDEISMDEILAMYRPARFDNLTVDYLGLTKGMDLEDQWRKMSSAVRTCVRFAATDNSIITLLCQLTAEGVIRYSRGMAEHAHLAWTWTTADDEAGTGRLLMVRQPKTRNLKSFDFVLREQFHVMRVTDVDPEARPATPQRGARTRRTARNEEGGNGQNWRAGDFQL